MCGHHAQNLLVLKSPQLSFMFGPYVRTSMDLYRQYVDLSPVSKGLRCYLSQNIGPAVARSAGPAPLPPVVGYTDSTEVVSTDVGCCSWPFYC